MDTNMNQTLRALFCSGLLLALASACASHGPEIRTLGFLENYGQLSPGHKGQASLIYIDGEADFSAYSAILIDPVVAWPTPDGQPAISTRELAENFDEDLRRELAREFDLVDQPDAGALHLRTALASKGGSHLVLEVEVLEAAIDRRKLESTDSTVQTDAWAVLIRNRLASFRQFDSAWRAREAGAAP